MGRAVQGWSIPAQIGVRIPGKVIMAKLKLPGRSGPNEPQTEKMFWPVTEERPSDIGDDCPEPRCELKACHTEKHQGMFAKSEIIDSIQ